MIYLTGDTHGDFRRVAAFCDKVQTSRDDVLIILGDAGVNYSCDDKERVTKRHLSELPVTLLCVHGNHERRPSSISSYSEIIRFGGVVYAESDFPNILFAKDGEVYDLDGRKAIVIGGAYSVDKNARLLNGWKWFPDEQPSAFIRLDVERKLESLCWSIDTVLSHTCPFRYLPYEVFMSGIDQRDVDNSTEEWLGTIEYKLSYKHWYCGHFHTSKVVDKLRFMFEDFISLA